MRKRVRNSLFVLIGSAIVTTVVLTMGLPGLWRYARIRSM